MWWLAAKAALGKVGGKVLGILAGVVAIAAILLRTWFGGKRQAHLEHEVDTLRATQAAQQKVGDAERKDREVDARTAAEVEAAGQEPAPAEQPGGRYEL
jgi:FtsZ-interacting cell division protein ZipA